MHTGLLAHAAAGFLFLCVWQVYDLTTFLDEHPGGKKSILKYAGKDGTRPFDLAGHPVDMAARLGKEDLIIGEVEAQAGAYPARHTRRAALRFAAAVALTASFARRSHRRARARRGGGEGAQRAAAAR